MIDPTVQRLLEHVVDSPIKLQIVLLFCDNTRMSGTASQLANRIYRDIWSTREALHELTEDGILKTVDGPGETIYCYWPALEHIEPIARLYESYNEPLERDHLQRAVREVASYAPYRRANGGMLVFERM
jgi:hypothetical protein